MVIIFSGRNSETESQIIDILCKHGGDYISDKAVCKNKGLFTVVSEYKKTDLKLKKGIALVLDDTERFKGQSFPLGIIGICEESNKKALQIFQNSAIPVISCGMSSKNTITASSLDSEYMLATLMRTITDINSNDIEAGEYHINLSKNYSPLSVMASVAVLLLLGITPKDF